MDTWLCLIEMQSGIGMKSNMVSKSFFGFICLVQAFMILCDWLLILSHLDSNNNEETVGLLGYIPNTALQEKLFSFIQEHVFMDEEEEEKKG